MANRWQVGQGKPVVEARDGTYGPSMSATSESGEMLPRAARLARSGNLPAALDELRGTSTFELRAAYAQAVRRRAEGREWAAASELLEVALLARQRKVLRGVRWHDRPEVVAPLWFGFWAVWWATRMAEYGWAAALIAALTGATLMVLAWRWLLRPQSNGRLPASSIAGQGRIDLVRVSDATDAVLRLVEQDGSATTDDIMAVARQRARGIGGDLVAAVSLGRAERALRNSFAPAHRRASAPVAAARERVLAHHLDAEVRTRLPGGGG